MSIRLNHLKPIGLALSGILFAGSAHALTGEGDPVPHQQQNQASQTAGLEERFAQAQMELQQIAEILTPVQQQAQAQPEVQESLLSYDAVLVEQMAEINPEARKDIHRRGELFKSLVSAGDPAELSPDETQAFQESVEQFMELRQNLDELEMQAQGSQAVQAEFTQYQEAFMAANVQIEPRAEELMERQFILHQELSQMEQQVLRQ